MESISDGLKMRVLQLKSKIPHKIDYLVIYKNHFKIVDDEKHLNRVRDVWNLRVADSDITNRLEHIADQYKKVKL